MPPVSWPAIFQSNSPAGRGGFLHETRNLPVFFPSCGVVFLAPDSPPPFPLKSHISQKPRSGGHTFPLPLPRKIQTSYCSPGSRGEREARHTGNTHTHVCPAAAAATTGAPSPRVPPACTADRPPPVSLSRLFLFLWFFSAPRVIDY